MELRLFPRHTHTRTSFLSPRYIEKRTMECSNVHEAFPRAPLLGGQSVTVLGSALVLRLDAEDEDDDKSRVFLNMETMSAQAGRSQSSSSGVKLGGGFRNLEAMGLLGSPVPVIVPCCMMCVWMF
jgi:hypothetical protein